MDEPSLIGVIDSYGIELLHPRRERRSDKQIGCKNCSNRRWIMDDKLLSAYVQFACSVVCPFAR